MTDIVERLLVCAKYDPDQADAAAEITRLRAENERLRAALGDVHAAAKDNHLVAKLARAALEEK